MTERVFLRLPPNINDMSFSEALAIQDMGKRIEQLMIEASLAGYDVEVVRVSVPPWRMGRVQTHVRIWKKP